MYKRLRASIFIFVLAFGAIPCASAEDDALAQAKTSFRHEDYEEALTVLTDLRAESPASSEVAFYLGMTHKRLQDYRAAKPHLEAAATLQPFVKEAVPELIDLLYQLDDTAAAKEWIARAEKEGIAPAQTTFFKGLVRLKEGDAGGAIDALEDAERLDPALAEAVQYQKGVAYLQLQDYTQARAVFGDIVTRDPSADLALFADEYIDALARREQATRPFRGSVGYTVQFDDNVIARPNNKLLSAGIPHERDWRHVVTAEADYRTRLTDRVSVLTGYDFYGSHHDEMGFYDTQSHDVPVQPTIQFEKVSFSFPLRYNYVSLNEQKYADTIGVGHLTSLSIASNAILQFRINVDSKDYEPWSFSIPEDERSGEEYSASASWIRFFGASRDGLLQLRYEASREETDGSNWRHTGHRATAAALLPVGPDLKWNAAVDYLRQDFDVRHKTYNKNRHDDVLTVSNQLSWEFAENYEFTLSHSFVYDAASIGIYKYKKNIYGAGIRYRF